MILIVRVKLCMAVKCAMVSFVLWFHVSLFHRCMVIMKILHTHVVPIFCRTTTTALCLPEDELSFDIESMGNSDFQEPFESAEDFRLQSANCDREGGRCHARNGANAPFFKKK